MARDLPAERPNAGRPAERARDLPMTPAERRALAKAVKIASGGRRRREHLADKSRRRLKKAGIDLDGNIVTKAAGNILEDFAYAPAGIYEIGKAATLDTRDLARGLGGREGGDLTPTRTRDVGKQIVEGTAETIRHPLRRPGSTLLLALGGYGAAAGGVSRVSAAGTAAKAARAAGKSPARAALTRPGHQGGSLLSRPVPGPRVRRLGDMEVRSRYSTSPGVAAIQKGKDKLEARLAGTGPGETYGIRKTGKELGQNRRVAEDAKRGPAKRLARMGRKLTAPQQQALRLWGQNVTVDQKIAQHKQALTDLAASSLPESTKRKRAAQLGRRIALTEAARPYMKGSDLADDFQRPKHGLRRGATAARLAATARQADRVAGRKPGGRERALLDAGVIEPEQIDFRLDAPGRLTLGAKWTTAASDAVRRLDDIEKRRSAIHDASKTIVPGKTRMEQRPRTREEAEGRLKDLDDVLNPLVSQLAADLRAADTEMRRGGEGAAVDRYSFWINRYGKTEGSRIAGLPPEDRAAEGFVQNERRGFKNRQRPDWNEVAEEMLSQVAGRDKTQDLDVNDLLAVHESLTGQRIDMVKLRKALDERDDLRARFHAAEPTPDEVFSGAPAREPDFGTRTVTVREPDRVERQIGDEGARVLTELDKAELRAFEDLQRGDQMILSGAEDFPGGRVRIPDVPEKLPKTPTFGRGSVYRGGQPRQPESLRRDYTGALEETGGYRIKATRNIAESALEAHKYTNLLDLRDKVLKAGVDARPADTRLVQWVPVRKKQLTAKQRRMLTESEPHPDTETGLLVTPDERAAVEGTPWERFLEDVFPQKLTERVPVGGTVPNVVWVPRQLLANMNKPFARSGWAPALGALDTVLNLVKAGIIPLKTGYITANAVGSTLFNLTQQGVFLPRNWKQAVSLLRDERTAATVRELMGSGGMAALTAGNPRGSGRINQALHAYSHVLSEVMLEPMMRVSALVHEMHRMGHKTNAQIHRVMTDPKHADDLTEIVRRATSAIIDYDRLGPVEKAVARRALFIYPWVKGATMYGGNFLMEHPVQAGVGSAVAQHGREEALRDLGPVPSWARGTFKVGGSDDMPLVVNPGTISQLSQVAEVGHVGLNALLGGGGSADQLGGMLHPVIQSATEAAFKRDLFTGAPLQGSFLGLLLRRSLAQTAPATLRENIEKSERPPGNRAYPMSRGQAILRNTFGSFMPRTAQRDVLNKAARTEAEHDLSPGQRARRAVFRERQATFEAVKQHNPELLVNGRLHPDVRQAYNRKAQVEAGRRSARKAARGDSLTYYRQVAVNEARLLEKWGALPKGAADRIAERVGSMSLEAVRDGVQRMRDDLMPDSYRDITSEAGRYLERVGAQP